MNSSRIRRRLLLDQRGASALEYALLICTILLVVAAGYRLLGRGETQTANKGVKTLEGSLEKAGGNVDPGNGVASADPSDRTDPSDDGPDLPPAPPASNQGGGEPKHSGGGFWGGVGNFFKGAIGGDAAGDTGWQGALGQVVVGFIPIVGDVAAARDLVHGAIDVAHGKPGGWEEVGVSAISLIPEAGGLLKAGAKGAREAHAVEEGVAGVEKGAAKGGEKGAEKAPAATGPVFPKRVRGTNAEIDPVTGEEIYYRVMQPPHAQAILNGQGVQPGSETFISPTESYVSENRTPGNGYTPKYQGVLVKIKVKPGTTAELTKIGVTDASNQSQSAYPNLPRISKGWMKKNAVFKAEEGQINIGLGKGDGLKKFNDSITGVEIIQRPGDPPPGPNFITW